MRKPGQGIKLNDVATAAGVSRATVSYVLTGNGIFRGVASSTIEKVTRIAKELNYVPNLAARNLRTNRSGLVGVLLPGFQIGWAHQLELGIQKVLEERDCLPVFMPHHDNAHTSRARFNTLLQHQVDGVLIHAPVADNLPFYRERIPAKPPIVFFTDIYSDLAESADCVLFDGYAAAVQAAERLLARGCRRPAVVHSTSCWIMKPRRYEGFCDTMRARGLLIDPSHDLLLHLATRTEPDVCSDLDAWVHQIMSRPDTAPDGIFCEHDSVAIHLLNAFCRMGRTAPDHTPNVVSIGNLPVRDECGRGITSMSEPIDRIGREAAELLFHRLEHPAGGPEKRVISESFLHLRNSA